MATSLYLDHPKEKGTGKLKETAVSILLKFYIDKKNRFDISAGEKIIPKYWDAKKQQARASMTGHIELNLSLNKLKSDVVQLWRDNKEVSIDELKAMAQAIIKYGTATPPAPPVEKKSLLDVIAIWIEQAKKEKDKKTVAKYEGLENKLKEFPKPKGLYIEDTDLTFLDAFKTFLYAYPNRKYKDRTLHLHESGDYWEIRNDTRGLPIGLFDDTVYKYISNLQVFLTWAEARKYNVDQSYKTWEIIHRRYKPISLTLSELTKVEQLDITPELVLERLNLKSLALNAQARKTAAGLAVGRDYLAMECRTGQRISDIKRFDPLDYFDYKWTFYPRKGNRLSEKQVTVYFQGYTAPALFILAHYNWKMPKISEQKLNKIIKKVCLLAGIDQEITVFRWIQNKKVKISGLKYEFISTHTGRKTFITIALQYMPPKVVMDLTGIESFETLNHYMDDSDEVNVVTYLNKIETNTPLRIAQ
jgi:hypothetical protein